MKIVPIVMLAALVATPAFAGHAKKRTHNVLPSVSLQEPGWRNSRNQYRSGYVRGPNVYAPSGRFIGRDPSLNIRQQMYDEDLRLRRGS